MHLYQVCSRALYWWDNDLHNLLGHWGHETVYRLAHPHHSVPHILHQTSTRHSGDTMAVTDLLNKSTAWKILESSVVMDISINANVNTVQIPFLGNGTTEVGRIVYISYILTVSILKVKLLLNDPCWYLWIVLTHSKLATTWQIKWINSI